MGAHPRHSHASRARVTGSASHGPPPGSRQNVQLVRRLPPRVGGRPAAGGTARRGHTAKGTRGRPTACTRGGGTTPSTPPPPPPPASGAHSIAKAPTENGVHSIAKAPVETGVQSVAKAPMEIGAHSIAKAPVENGVQSVAKAPVENGAHSIAKAPVENGAQSIAKALVENGAQSVAKAPVEIGAQSIVKAMMENGAQAIATAPVENGARSIAKALVENGVQPIATAPLEDGAQSISKAPVENTDLLSFDLCRVLSAKEDSRQMPRMQKRGSNYFIEWIPDNIRSTELDKLMCRCKAGATVTLSGGCLTTPRVRSLTGRCAGTEQGQQRLRQLDPR